MSDTQYLSRHPDEEMEDVTWFAIDDNNHVGQFASGGLGPLPWFVSHAVYRELDELGDLVGSLPTRGGAVVDQAAMRDVRFPRERLRADAEASFLRPLVKLAQSGLYIYDVRLVHPRPQPYQRMVVPERPVAISELPLKLAGLLRENKLAGVRFDLARTIGPELIGTRPGRR